MRRLQAPQSGNRVTWDDEVKGFGARITAAGAVSFVLRHVRNGRERRMTIGAYPDLSPSAAREIAVELRAHASPAARTRWNAARRRATHPPCDNSPPAT